LDLKKRMQIESDSISITFGSSKWFTNDDQSRSFLGLEITQGESKVCELIKDVDKVLQQFSFPLYYKDPRPHVSIGWTLGNVLPDLRVPERVLDEEDTFDFDISNIECKCGKWLFRLVD